MNKKKIGAALTAAVLATSVLGFANETTTSTATTKTQITAEQSSRKSETKAKWDALSTAQKNEVYQIESEIVALKKKQIDKLVSLGVYDQATGDAKKKALDEQLATAKSNLSMPKSGKGRKNRPNTTSTTKTPPTTQTK